MSTPPPDDAPLVPVETGNAAIDAALAALDLDTDLHEHPQRLAATLEALHAVLNPPAPTGSPVPRPHP